MTHCKRCGRPLTNPKSIELGYGPICAKKVLNKYSNFKDKNKKIFLDSKLISFEDFFKDVKG